MTRVFIGTVSLQWQDKPNVFEIQNITFLRTSSNEDEFRGAIILDALEKFKQHNPCLKAVYVEDATAFVLKVARELKGTQ